MQISKYMSQFLGVKLLMGDFNDEPHSNAIRYVSMRVCVCVCVCMCVHACMYVIPLPHPLSLPLIPLCVIQVQR